MNQLIINYEPFTKTQTCSLIDKDNNITVDYVDIDKLTDYIRSHQYINSIIIHNSKTFNKKKLANFAKTNIKISYL